MLDSTICQYEKNNLTISIIIPVYNAATEIYGCINSITENLKAGTFEIIVIDGTSTDNTVELVLNYPCYGRNLKCISDIDNGIYDAMNKGINKANAPFCLFLGADDRLLVKSKYIEKYLDDTNNIYYGNVILGDSGSIYDGLFDSKKLIRKNICHQSIFYPTKILKQYFFTLKYKFLADWALNITLWKKYNWVYLPIIIAQYSNIGISTIRKDTNFRNEMIFLIYKHLGFTLSLTKIWFVFVEKIFQIGMVR
jgi:glycosyltransferase involved in cell wall biosynthesis